MNKTGAAVRFELVQPTTCRTPFAVLIQLVGRQLLRLRSIDPTRLECDSQDLTLFLTSLESLSRHFRPAASSRQVTSRRKHRNRRRRCCHCHSRRRFAFERRVMGQG
ncbi:hypothetical protein SCHPADRAFT_702251 [Schizopora paradoxa]|uniref:Uncharacterized protein n=1 Tax=Schizopora paradoxa TaxID=27342 RepID=A0A0H2R2R7_9AGAM|nr:hypothetical protein SCHPADRAFT_702251 [Schizopora paradoxa]